MTKISLQNRDIYVLIFLLPIARCVLFWLKVTIGIDLWNFFSYFDFLLALYMYFVIFRGDYSVAMFCFSAVTLCAFLYNLAYNININASFSYLYSMHNVLLPFLIFHKLDFSRIDINRLRKALIVFGILFVIIYEFSSLFAVSRNNESEYYGVERIYKEGFVISHSGCYYLVVLAYFLLILKERLLGIMLLGYTLTLGARIGYVYIGLSIFMLCINSYKNIAKSLHQLRYIVFLFILFALYIIIENAINTVGLEGLMVFTSGRSIFWMNALNEMSNDWLGIINFFGRGPKYSFIFNEMTVGLKIWMHNDFVDLLFNVGYVGLFLYISGFFYFLHNVPTMYLFFIFIFSAIFNGFIYYDPLFVIMLSLVFAKKKLGY